MKVFDEVKLLYEEFKDCFLVKVSSVADKILKISKAIKNDKNILDNPILFDKNSTIQIDEKGLSG